KWVDQQARKDGVDFILLVPRDGFVLERLAQGDVERDGPPFAYFEGSRIAFTLASINDANFAESLDFLLTGSLGLSPFELFERIGVAPPADPVMEDLGLGAQQRIRVADLPQMARLLSAFKAEILKVCRRNRRGLLLMLHRLGVRS